MAKMLSLSTHALSLVAGGAVAWIANSGGEMTSHSRPETRVPDRESPTSAARQSEQLVQLAIAASKAPAFDPAAIAAAAAAFKSAVEAEAYLKGRLPTDAERSDDIVAAGALLHWFRADPQSALGFHAINNLLEYTAAIELGLQELDAFEILELTSSQEKSPSAITAKAAALKLSSMAPDEAARIISTLGLTDDPQTIQLISRGWPSGEWASYIDLAVALNDPQWIETAIKRQPSPREASRLLIQLEERTDLPEAFKAGIALEEGLRAHLYRYADPSVSIEDRIAAMAPLYDSNMTPHELREIALKQISTVDINELMKSGPDYRYALRHGALDADQILDEVRAQMPQMANASEYETRIRVFNELASENAKAAFSLIDDLPAEQRKLAVLHQARWSFRNTAPDAFAAMIGLAPGPDDTTAANDRQDAWASYHGHKFNQYGEYYLDWVRELPAGVDRDVARATLATQLEQANKPELAKEFQRP